MDKLRNKTEPSGAPESTAARPRTRRILDVRLLVETLIVAAILAPVAYFWYSYQLKRAAAAMLERAHDLAESNDDRAAAQYYFQYLKLRPDDVDAQVLLAKTYDRAAKGPREKESAVPYFYQALGVAPPGERPELRRRLAELLLELQALLPEEKKYKYLAAAAEQAQELLALKQDDPQGWRILAMALYGQSATGVNDGGVRDDKIAELVRRARPVAAAGQGNKDGSDKTGKPKNDAVTVAEVLQRAHALNPDDIEIASGLVDVYRNKPRLLDDEQQALPQADRNKLADQVVDDVVTASPQSAKAYLARYRYRADLKLPNAADDLAAALKYGPDDPEVLLNAGLQAMRDAQAALGKGGSPKDVQAKLAQASKYYEHAAEVAPADERAYLKLAGLYGAQGKPDDAVKWLRTGLEKGDKENVDPKSYLTKFALNSALADLLIGQGKLDDAEKTLGELERVSEKVSPFLTSSAKVSLTHTNDLLRGKWLVRKGQYAEAIPRLRLVAVGQLPAESFQAWKLLGIAYGAIGQWDQAATAYEQAAATAPKSGQVRRQAAAAWAMAGRSDVAAAYYKQALDLDRSAGVPVAPQTLLALARVEYQQILRLPKEERHWDSFDRALAEAQKAQSQTPTDKKRPAEAWALKLLEADYNLARADEKGEKDRAVGETVAMLQALEKEHPDSAALDQSLVATYERLGQPADADRVLEQLEKRKDQAAVACLLRASLYASRKQYDQAKKVLATGLETLPAEMRPVLRRAMVQVSTSEGRWDQVRDQLRKLHEMEPANLELVVQLAELAFETRNYPDLEQWEKELRKLEGADGLFWQYYGALRLVAQASGPEDAKLAQASELQGRVQNQRPAWPKAYVLQGLLSEGRGSFDQAVEAYQEAIRLGEQQSMAYERLISLLTQLDRAAEAEHYLGLLQGQIAGSERLSELEIQVAAKQGQFGRALETARHGVQQRPQDPLAYLWLGQVLSAGGNAAEAETALKKAVELAPRDVRTLDGLFGFYARTKQPDRARETLQELVKNEKLTDGQRASILAQGYAALGDQEKAKANYRQAAKLAADDVPTQLRLAEYLLRTGTGLDNSEVEQVLRGVLQRKPDSGEARRMLAELLMERGGEKEWQEAIQLVEPARGDRSMPEVDRRMEGILLARRGGKENLDQARQIFEELVADPKKANAFDRQRLAQLYELDGKPDLARQQYLKLVSGKAPSPAQLAAYVGLLLRYERYDEADSWLKKLESLAPDDLGVVMLRARWLHGTNKDALIEPLVQPLVEKLMKTAADDKQQEAAIALRVGALYSVVGQPAAAERWYRRLAELQPDRYEPLANTLAQQGRVREAIELCQKAAQSDASVQPALVLAAVLMAGKPTADDFRLAEETLSKALANHKDDLGLLSAVAGVRLIQQRTDDAIQLYRQILALKPTQDNLATQVGTLNNLATLLAEPRDGGDKKQEALNRQEALTHIDRAIQIIGPQPELLDTKGMILVFDGKPTEAIPLLQEATAAPRSDPRYHFHLAVAYDRAGEAEKARAALSTAQKGDLTRKLLTPLDRQMLADLEKRSSP